MSVIAASIARLDAATDGHLLGRFVQARDADAFAALVKRLGPTVLAVCRRVCPDSHLAEDAFQAAFLVLARKAESVRPREQVAVWLHGVAYRTASKARAMLVSRRRREADSAALPDPPAPDPVMPDDAELRKLDAAIAGLPAHLRAAVVLCELEGRSRKDAAALLGIPAGTLSSRLAEARKRLGDRLRPAVAAVVTAALAVRTAEAVVGGATSETVRSLARGVTSMLLLQKLRVPLLIGLALATAAVAVPLLTPAHSAPVPKSLKPSAGGIGVTKGGVLSLLTPDGTRTHQFDVEAEWQLKGLHKLDRPCRVCPSPNGFPVAVLVPRSGATTGEPRYELRLIRSADDAKRAVIDLSGHLAENERLSGRLVWSRSGKRFFVGVTSPGPRRIDTTDCVRDLVVNVATGEVTPAVLPDGHRLVGEAPDGTLVAERMVALRDEWSLHRVSADGKTVTPLKACPHYATGRNIALAPDGRTVLSWKGDNMTEPDTLFAFDAETGEATDIVPNGLLASFPPGKKLAVQQARWSPDGKRVGFLYYQWKDTSDALTADVTLYVCDRDGSNGRAVFTWKHEGDTPGEMWDAWFEWN